MQDRGVSVAFVFELRQSRAGSGSSGSQFEATAGAGLYRVYLFFATVFLRTHGVRRKIPKQQSGSEELREQRFGEFPGPQPGILEPERSPCNEGALEGWCRLTNRKSLSCMARSHQLQRPCSISTCCVQTRLQGLHVQMLRTNRTQRIGGLQRQTKKDTRADNASSRPVM